MPQSSSSMSTDQYLYIFPHAILMAQYTPPSDNYVSYRLGVREGLLEMGAFKSPE